MANLITAAMWIAIGIACSISAKKQGKNPYLWFVLGVLFGIFGLIALFLIKTLRRKHKSQPKAPQPPLPLPPSIPHQNWYYLEESHEQKGPVSLPCIMELKDKGTITHTSFIWNAWTVEWKKFEEVFGNEKTPM